ncbi:unnamed protein product [Coregonus sp. 'balchen']|nr:unnamed protein product [Coregonus sp. 'balchen']
MSNGRVTHDKFLEWSETYGPVYRINGLHVVMLCVTCPDTTKEVLMSPKYPKDSLVYKRLFNLFGQRYLRGQMGAFNERAENLMDKLADMADNNTAANMHHMFNRVTLDVITKVAFGVELDLLKESDTPFPNAIEMCLKGMVHYLRDSTFQLYPKNKKFINEVKESVHLLRSTGRQWINERKMAVQNGEDVLKETLRLYPTAPGTSRFIPNDIVINGIPVPAGVTCIFNSYVCGRLDKFFEDPLKFDPERFHPDATK